MNKLIIENGYIGACHKNLSFEYLSKIQIPIIKPEIMKEHKLKELFKNFIEIKPKLELDNDISKLTLVELKDKC